MLKPGSRVGEMCADVIPIAKYEENLKIAIKQKLETIYNNCVNNYDVEQ